MDGVALFVGGSLRYIDRVAATLLGYAREEEALGRPIEGLVPPAALELRRKRCGEDAVVGPFEARVLRCDGSIAELQTWAAPALYEGQEAVQVTMRDLAQARQEDLERAELRRLLLLGELASGVANELRNIFSPLLADAVRLGMDPRSPETHAAARRLADGARRALDTLDSFLLFVREHPARLKPTDVNGLVFKVLREMAPVFQARGIEVHSEFRAAVNEVPVDPYLLERALSQLLRNAEQAIADADRPGRVRVTTYRDEGVFSVSVSDNGCGIAEEDLPRVFEPFFTTRQPGLGIGLGLTIARHVARAHGGELLADSRFGEGSTFTIRIPVRSARPASAPIEGESYGGEAARPGG